MSAIPIRATSCPTTNTFTWDKEGTNDVVDFSKLRDSAMVTAELVIKTVSFSPSPLLPSTFGLAIKYVTLIIFSSSSALSIPIATI